MTANNMQGVILEPKNLREEALIIGELKVVRHHVVLCSLVRQRRPRNVLTLPGPSELVTEVAEPGRFM